MLTAFKAPENSLDATFARCREEGRAALVLYITSGFPTAEATERVLPVLAQAGCDLVELGVPFSDPIADGPTIQRSSTIALHGGMTFPHTLEILKGFRREHETPVILFGAYNPYLVRGLENAARMAKEAGAQGILAADVPHEESEEFRGILAAEGLHLITLLAPTTPSPRIKAIASDCTGFLYCVSLKGTTGGQELGQEASSYLARVRAETELPLALGFGIKRPEHVRMAVNAGADGIVVGSELVNVIERAWTEGSDGFEDKVAEYVRSLAAELKKG